MISNSLSQYHQRLLTLDTQVKHLEAKSLLSLGHWLSRKWQQCQTKKTVVTAELARLRISEDELREQWALQLQYQTQPATSRTFQIIVSRVGANIDHRLFAYSWCESS
jgi:hypothetical protein